MGPNSEGKNLSGERRLSQGRSWIREESRSTGRARHGPERPTPDRFEGNIIGLKDVGGLGGGRRKKKRESTNRGALYVFYPS